jgi:AbrB family looped-hinge helix DNA binding protein
MATMQRSKITSKRQVTFPKRVMDAMGLKAGDSIEIEQRADGFFIRPCRIREEMLAPLRGKVTTDKGPFNVEEFRDARKDPALRD